MRFHPRLEHYLHHSLCDAVRHSRNAERTRTAVVLRYFDKPHGRRKIGARRHPIPDLIEMFFRSFSNAASDSPSTPAAALTRWYASHTSCFGIAYGFASGTGSSPHGLTRFQGWRVGLPEGVRDFVCGAWHEEAVCPANRNRKGRLFAVN